MSVSVIIPTLNEADWVGDTIRNVRAQGPKEIIVVDCGSSDGTIRAARGADLVMEASRGRAHQMNAGAAQASGSTLLFLHADCTLEPGALIEAEKLLDDAHVAAGCFRMHVTRSGWMFRWVDAVATLRVRLSGLMYGDQGIFTRRTTFETVGGFPGLRLMEDVFISKRLRHEGKIVVAPKNIFVSQRRWERAGLVRQTMRNWSLMTLAAAGVHPDRLARFYPVVR